MGSKQSDKLFRRGLWSAVVFFAAALISTPAWAFTVSVVDPSGSPVSGFRWLVEEDTTIAVTPGVPSSSTLSVSIPRTHSPVAAKGHSATASFSWAGDPTKRYLVSVLPDAGYAMSGRQVAAGQSAAKVTVNPHPVPTAQISVLVFEDNQPLNSAPDIPAEAGLEGFEVFIYDYAGPLSQDAFGNPLGTTYNSDGSVLAMGSGVLLTNANGEVKIMGLAPGKYGIQAIPRRGEQWVQTATIEGTRGIDAWVRAGEPPYFIEFGIASWHAFIGFVRPTALTGGGSGTITGRAVYIHDVRPPLTPTLYSGGPVPYAWVGLNDLSGSDEMVYAQPCEPDGSFTISNVPAGTYQLVVWDQYLDVIIDFRTVVIPAGGGTIALGDTAVNAWFGRLSGSVFNDLDEDGFRDPGENGIPGQALNLRFPDGTIYSSTVTNPMGDYSFKEVFPWFFWTILEVDYARFQATGATVIVDNGGQVAPGLDYNPQPQPENGGQGFRTETGPSLVEGFILYAGQHNIVNWGKKAYEGADNGGISGIVSYATTRAEDDPRLGVMDSWEPGIPRVQVSLYQDFDNDKVIDDVNGDGQVTLADVDNEPLGNFPGTEDVDRNGNHAFDPGDALQIVTTDSWDDNLPSGCVGDPQFVHGQQIVDCANTLRTWNQVRPAVFDGGYAFWTYFPGGMESGSVETAPLAVGRYVVETAVPPGYELVKEEDKNVVFGDPFAPAVDMLPPECVGAPHVVPAELSLFPGEPAGFAGETRPLCDRKSVAVQAGINAAANFFLFTEVPVAAHDAGIMTNDIMTDFDLNSPQYGDKLGPAWMPIAFRDFNGAEMVRAYTDEWGRYNAILPSTYTVNVASPTGVSPSMIQLCLNDPGPIEDPTNPGQWIEDPWYDPRYSRTCQSLDFFPGKTTFTDTPVLPIAAFTGAPMRLDCEFPDHTPVINSVDSRDGGPALNFGAGLWVGPSARSIKLESRGTATIPNPFYDPNTPGSPTTITRDYGFGATRGQVLLGGRAITINSWSADGKTIVATVPTSATTGQLEVVRGDNGLRTTIGVTLNINESPIVRVSAGQSIQAALDAAPSGALILVAPGHYGEHLIMTKKHRLQGWGAYTTYIDPLPMLPPQEAAWDAKVAALIDSGAIELLEGARANFFLEKGSGVLVATKDGEFNNTKRARIDGFTISGAIHGGGVFANAYARYLEVSNNRIVSNQGTIGGGIRLGWSSLLNAAGDGYLSSQNNNVSIHNNSVSMNGSIDNGGGIAVNNGADNYSVLDNFVCGNYTLQYGAGIVHHGLSRGGAIQGNKVLFNQATDEGGGVMLAGELPAAGFEAGQLTEGIGPVLVNRNLIQGNLSGDDGGGLRLLMANGEDVRLHPSAPSFWHAVRIFNNVIVNNVSADAGGGVSLDDAALVAMYHNTVAGNDSSATGVDAFGNCTVGNPPGQTCPPGAGGNLNSVPRAAGMASNAHSAGLQAAFATPLRQTYSNPSLINNIFWRNRSFWWNASANGGLGGLVSAGYWDLGVYGVANPTRLNPTYGVLTSTTGYSSTNTASNPRLASPYENNLIAHAGGLGNLVYVTFTPISFTGNYHILANSSALSRATMNPINLFSLLRQDYDRQRRPNGSPDAGADEYWSGATPPMTLGEASSGLPLGGEAEPLDEEGGAVEPIEPLPLGDDEASEAESYGDAELTALIAAGSADAADGGDAAPASGDDDAEGGCGS